MTQTTLTKEQLALVEKLLSEWYEGDRDKRSLDCDGYTSLRAIFINAIVEQAEAAAASARETALEEAAKVCESRMTCGCGRDDCYTDRIPEDIAESIRAIKALPAAGHAVRTSTRRPDDRKGGE